MNIFALFCDESNLKLIHILHSLHFFFFFFLPIFLGNHGFDISLSPFLYRLSEQLYCGSTGILSEFPRVLTLMGMPLLVKAALICSAIWWF
jgi:hypothetical protein